MKISIIFLLSIALHGVFTVNAVKSPKTKKLPGVTRPGFDKDVNNLIKDMANVNGYTAKFDRCHVVPWKFIATMVDEFTNGNLPKGRMNTFIKDLARIHKSASFYYALSKTTKKTLENLTNNYKTNALAAVKAKDPKKLARMLFNIPSNLYPGDRRNNRSIQDNLDPPKEELGSGGRSNEAVQGAKTFLAKYAKYGLTAKDDPSAPGVKVKSSDIPPGDTSGDYVKII